MWILLISKARISWVNGFQTKRQLTGLGGPWFPDLISSSSRPAEASSGTWRFQFKVRIDSPCEAEIINLMTSDTEILLKISPINKFLPICSSWPSSSAVVFSSPELDTLFKTGKNLGKDIIVFILSAFGSNYRIERLLSSFKNMSHYQIITVSIGAYCTYR